MAQPEKRFEASPCSAAVFVNEIATEQGKKQLRSVALQRSYKDKDGKFQATSTFGVNDIPKAIVVLQHAYEYLLEKKAE